MYLTFPKCKSTAEVQLRNIVTNYRYVELLFRINYQRTFTKTLLHALGTLFLVNNCFKLNSLQKSQFQTASKSLRQSFK